MVRADEYEDIRVISSAKPLMKYGVIVSWSLICNIIRGGDRID